MTTTTEGSTKPSWQEIGRRKREQVLALLPQEWGLGTILAPEEQKDVTSFPNQFLSEEETRITESSVGELLLKLARGELKAVQVTKAFCHRATIAHQLTNCLSEVMFDQALAEAAELDAFYEREGHSKGLLHGLPISLKDQFRVRGAETSLGYISWLGKTETPESESWLVKQLRNLGAVFYVKTNVPSSLMSIETNNNIIGYTRNATNRLLSCGGSSGGEAALIAMKASPIGLGSDVGASIRLPAALNGIVGLKPSHGRIPYLQVANSMEGSRTLRSTIGPMGHKVSDLRLMTKAILSTQPWTADPDVLRLPWRFEDEMQTLDKIRSRSLTFAVMNGDGAITPHPPVDRVLNEAVVKLRASGYKVVDWNPPNHGEGMRIVWDAFVADAGKDIHDALAASGEEPVQELACAYGKAYGDTLSPKTVNDLWANQKRQDKFRADYLRYWNSTDVDAVIMPVTPVIGFRAGKGHGLYAGYTAVFNALDYSVVNVRGGRVDGETDAARGDSFKQLSDFDAVLQALYDPQVFDKAPVGLQVICKRLEEEKVLAIAEEVERVVGDY